MATGDTGRGSSGIIGGDDLDPTEERVGMDDIESSRAGRRGATEPVLFHASDILVKKGERGGC